MQKRTEKPLKENLIAYVTVGSTTIIWLAWLINTEYRASAYLKLKSFFFLSPSAGLAGYNPYLYCGKSPAGTQCTYTMRLDKLKIFEFPVSQLSLVSTTKSIHRHNCYPSSQIHQDAKCWCRYLLACHSQPIHLYVYQCLPSKLSQRDFQEQILQGYDMNTSTIRKNIAQ